MGKDIGNKAKESTQNFIAGVNQLLKKSRFYRRLRRRSIFVGAVIVVLVFILTKIFDQAGAANIYSTLPSESSGSVTASVGTVNVSTGTIMRTVESTIAGSADFNESSGKQLRAYIKMDTVTAVPSKVFKLEVTINGTESNSAQNYAFNFKNASGTYSSLAMNANTITVATPDFTQTVLTSKPILTSADLPDLAEIQAYVNGGSPGGQPEVEVTHASSNGAKSHLYIDYLEMKFYEDVTPPAIGTLSLIPGGDPLIGTQTVTLSSATDSESGMKVVDFVYREKDIGVWRSMNIPDETAGAGNSYSVTWDTVSLPDGFYDIKAVAYDFVNNTADTWSSEPTQPITVRLQNHTDTPPMVSIISPANGSKVNNPVISVDATDDNQVTKVEFYDNNPNTLQPFATDFSPMGGWTATWNTPGTYQEGNPYQVWAIAFDNAPVSQSKESSHHTYYIDRTPPEVTGTPTGPGVSSSGTLITATFSEPMKASTLTGSNFKVEYDNNISVPGTLAWETPSKAVFTPGGDLPANKVFTVTLTNGLTDEAGNSLAEYSWVFETVDKSSPEVSAIIPGNDTPLKRQTQAVSVTATDNVGVNRVEVYWSLNLATWNLIGSDNNGADGWQVLLDTAGLPGDGLYSIQARAYDQNNNPPGIMTVQFDIDNTLPQVLDSSLVPAPGTENVILNPALKATFSEAVKDLFTGTTFSITFNPMGVIYPNWIYDGPTKTVTLTLPEGISLKYNTLYTVHISSSDIYDLRDNQMESEKTWSFTTIRDIIPPDITIQSVSPKTISPQNNDHNYDYTQVFFDLTEDGNDNSANVYLEVFDGVGTKVYQSPEINLTVGTNRSMTWGGINDSGGFVPDGDYTLNLLAVDSAGNTTREAVPDKVTVDNHGPAMTQAIAKSRGEVIISFNEPMNINPINVPFAVTETNPPNTALEVYTTSAQIDPMNYSLKTWPQKTARVPYTITVTNVYNVTDVVGNPIQSNTTIEFIGFNPHGLFLENTQYCSNCHITHSAVGPRLINTSFVKGVCHPCHGIGGESNYRDLCNLFAGADATTNTTVSWHPVERVNAKRIMVSCDNCHDVHGSVNPETGNLYAKNLRSQKAVSLYPTKSRVTYDANGVPATAIQDVYMINFSQEAVYRQGDNFCFACHGTGTPIPGGLADKQTYYPPEGHVHNTVSWEPYYWEPDKYDPDNNTKIRCLKCHLNHGSTKIKLIAEKVIFNDPVTNQVRNYTMQGCLCCTCHGEDPDEDNYNYNGKAIYFSPKDTNNPHYSSDFRCVNCHDPHSVQYGEKMLKLPFVTRPEAEDVAGGTYYNENFNWDNYRLCAAVCHKDQPKITNKYKDWNVETEIYTLPTTFWEDSYWSPDNDPANTDPRANLHDFHLNLKVYRPGQYGNATCKECHRFHGSVQEEVYEGKFSRPVEVSPGKFRTKSRLVGFPMRGSVSVQAYTYLEPLWKVIEGPPAGGTCNLICHGVVHDQTTYLAGDPPEPEINRDSTCYSCHGPGSANGDIQSLMGQGGTGGKSGSKHVVGLVDYPLEEGNGCLVECHRQHSIFDNEGRASNTLNMNWVGSNWSNEKNLCQNPTQGCHTSTTDLSPKITDKFSQTGHSYELPYHDYGVGTGGTYMGNCTKCHTPHGSDYDNLLSLENDPANEPGHKQFWRDTGTVNYSGNDNTFCYACHTNVWPNSPQWPGKSIYEHSSNLHGTRNLKGTDPANGYCNACHDVHGREYPAESGNLVPNLAFKFGVDSCYDCHNSFKAETFDWPGKVYNPPNDPAKDYGYAKGAHWLRGAFDSKHGAGYCEICHAVHGNDPTSSGVPVKELLWETEEKTCFNGSESGTSCHGTGDTSTKDIQTLYTTRTYKHGVITDSNLHRADEKNTAAGPGWLPKASRHAECEDCHNSHSSQAGTSVGTNNVKPSEYNVWGITVKDASGNPVMDPSDKTLWTDPNNPTGTNPTPGGPMLSPPIDKIAIIDNAPKEWQVCLKCHSKWAWGEVATAPDIIKWSWQTPTTVTNGQTDTMAEFNPNNYGHHAVIAIGNNQPGALSPNFEKTFTGYPNSPWSSQSRLACSDCHSFSETNDAKGTHGSNYRYILAKNTTGTGDIAVFCLNCHRVDVYGDTIDTTPDFAYYARVSHPMGNSSHIQASTSTANQHVSKIWCLNCHMGDKLGGSHGSNKGKGANIDTRGGYTDANNLPLGKRLMNGSNIISYNAKPGEISCYAAQQDSNLSSCSKSHGPASYSAGINYDYYGP